MCKNSRQIEKLNWRKLYWNCIESNFKRQEPISKIIIRKRNQYKYKGSSVIANVGIWKSIGGESEE
jgi:hypothetical protein